MPYNRFAVSGMTEIFFYPSPLTPHPSLLTPHLSAPLPLLLTSFPCPSLAVITVRRYNERPFQPYTSK